MTSNAARVPLFQDPGTQFRYGIHATILGKLVEVWSGQPFEKYLQENILDPLRDGQHNVLGKGGDEDRLAELYRPTNGQLEPLQNRIRAMDIAADIDRRWCRPVIQRPRLSKFFADGFG